MPGPAATTTTITPGVGLSVGGFTNVAGNYIQAVSFDTNTPITAAWTSSTPAGAVGVGTALTSDCAGYGVATVSLSISGTVSGGSVVFEVYDGTVYKSVNAARKAGAAVETGSYSLSNGENTWHIDVLGFQKVSVRLATAITGGGTATFRMTTAVGSMPTVLNVSLMTVLDKTKDSVTADIAAGAGTVINSNATANAVKTGTGKIIGLLIGDPGTAWTITIYDALTATGTPIAIIKPTSEKFIPFGPLAYSTGITIVTAGTTAGFANLVTA